MAGEHTLASDVPVLPPEHWANQPVDNDADSAISSELQSSTDSLASSILKYRTLHGRTFHKEQGDASYWAANDGRSCDTLDMAHNSFLLILDNKLYLAPDKKYNKVLDVGTGTGIWALDFADEHSETSVIGTDVSPIQPAWVPPNLQFEIDDFNSPWTFGPETFDYIHMRYLLGSVTDWKALFKEAYKALEPGGYLESYETSPIFHSDDGSVKPDSALAQWGALYAEGGKVTGRTFLVYEENLQVKGMQEAGFVNIQVKNIKVPYGVWPKNQRDRDIAEMYMVTLLNDVEGLILFLANILGWTREQISVFAAFLRRDSKNPDIHAHFWQRVVVGQKPEKK